MASISRRNFLAASAVAAGLVGLAGCNGGGTPAADPLAAPAADKYPIDAEEWGSGTPKHTEEVVGDKRAGDGWTRSTNEGGKALGVMDPAKLIQVDGFSFKDGNGNGKLDIWEDWRQEPKVRAEALAAALSVDEALGLMIHGSWFSLDTDLDGENPLAAMADAGNPNDPGTLGVAIDKGIRSVLNFSIAAGADAKLISKWVNTAQERAEKAAFSIPMNLSDNPIAFGFPGNIGLAATFDPALIKEVSSKESVNYRAVGISTLLGPQMDLNTDPRWSRITGCYGEDPALCRDLTNAYVSGLQSTYDDKGADLGWGTDSVIGMIKHFPGDGPGEGGRESHNDCGKYAVYPGNNMEAHVLPFVDGGLHLESKTGEAMAVMDSYSIAYSDDEEYGVLMGSAYSKWKNDILREKCGYEGVICSDWGITEDAGTSWGVKEFDKPTRYKMIVEAGVDQIGGTTFGLGTLREAYDLMAADQGEEKADERVRTSARRVLTTFFQTGITENPYVAGDDSAAALADADMLAFAGEVTDKSIVMVKNEGNVIKKSEGKPKVYVPMRYKAASGHRLLGLVPASIAMPFDEERAAAVMDVVTDTPADPSGPAGEDGAPTLQPTDIVRASAEQIAECDYAVVVVDSPIAPQGSGFNAETGEYVPISLQYGEYTADGPNVREVSISGDILPDGTKENRSYLGKSSIAPNSSDLQVIKDTVAAMGDKPVVVCMNLANPTVVGEFEADVAGILMGFGTSGNEFLNVVTGNVEPSGLLPLQMPKDMDAVEKQLEDVPRDMDCYVDAAGNEYDFGYGLNWSGVISDERTKKYCVEPLSKSEYIDL